MAWIRTVSPADAERRGGLLARLYDAAARRAGRIYQIIRLQSARPRVLQSSTRLYLEVMHSRDSGLSRAQREMIATTVSRVNHCHY